MPGLMYQGQIIRIWAKYPLFAGHIYTLRNDNKGAHPYTKFGEKGVIHIPKQGKRGSFLHNLGKKGVKMLKLPKNLPIHIIM